MRRVMRNRETIITSASCVARCANTRPNCSCASSIFSPISHYGHLNVDRGINFRNTFCIHTYIYIYIYVRRQRGNEISGICDGLLAKFRTLAVENACGLSLLHPRTNATKCAELPEVRSIVIIIFQVRAHVCLREYVYICPG